MPLVYFTIINKGKHLGYKKVFWFRNLETWGAGPKFVTIVV